jgi:hypothetical protein
MRNLASSLLLGALAAAGCSSSPSVSASEQQSAREILATPQAMDIVPAQTSVEMDARVDRGDGSESSHVDLPVVSGRAELVAAGDQLQLSGLILDLAPVQVPASIVPGGLTLTDLHLKLAAPVQTSDAVWSDGDDHLSADVRLSLDLVWSVQLSGKTYRLSDQRIDDLDVGVTVDRVNDRITFDAGGLASGARWSWADIVVFENLSVTLHAQS